MMYATHIEVAKGTATTAIIGAMLAGELPSNLVVNYRAVPEFLLVSSIVYVFVCWGSMYPDLDHPTSGVARAKDLPAFVKLFRPIIYPVNALINKELKMRHVQHRSKETHSMAGVTLKGIALYLILLLAVKWLQNRFIGSEAMVAGLLYVQQYLPLAIVSLWVGAMCHIVADMFTKEGAYVVSLLPKFKLVPADLGIGSWRPFWKFFSTGDDSVWEQSVRYASKMYFKITLGFIPVIALFPVALLRHITIGIR